MSTSTVSIFEIETPVRISNDFYSVFGEELFCPVCAMHSSDYSQLHQVRVDVFNRAEDAKTGQHTICIGDKTYTDNDINNNPSMRRQGLIVYFQCERHTENLIEFSISQHKGKTYIKNRIINEIPKPKNENDRIKREIEASLEGQRIHDQLNIENPPPLLFTDYGYKGGAK